MLIYGNFTYLTNQKTSLYKQWLKNGTNKYDVIQALNHVEHCEM